MNADTVAMGGGVVLSAVGVVATALNMTIGETPITAEGSGAVILIAAGFALASLGLAYSLYRISRDGVRVRVVHSLDAPARKIVDVASARLERAAAEIDEPESDG